MVYKLEESKFSLKFNSMIFVNQLSLSIIFVLLDKDMAGRGVGCWSVGREQDLILQQQRLER